MDREIDKERSDFKTDAEYRRIQEAVKNMDEPGFLRFKERHKDKIRFKSDL